MTIPARELRARLESALGERHPALRVVVEEAAAARSRAYLVGGPVRDLLLGEEVNDVDVLLTRELERVAKAAAKRLDARLVLRPRFLTATIETAESRLDLALPRAETYARPGVLPRVVPAPLEEDFARRDFSVNALALPLRAIEGEPDALLDLVGGRRDLETRRLRCLHDASFRDDPTRLLRGARYAARLRFRFEVRTARLMREAVEQRALATVSGERLHHEIERLLEERTPDRTAAATERAGLFQAIERGWVVDEPVRRGLRRLRRASLTPPWPEAAGSELTRAAGLRVLLLSTPPRARARVLDRLGLRGRPGAGVRADLQAWVGLSRSLAGAISPGRLDAKLADVSEAALLFAHSVGSGPVARHVTRYASRLRRAPSPIDGHAARRLGLRGPAVGELLRAARERALDGREIDERWLLRWAARRKG